MSKHTAARRYSTAARTPRAKRLLDVSLSAVLAALLAPVFVVALAAMASDSLLSRRDRGPFFYREERVSRGRTFRLVKLRTLRTDVLAEMRKADGHARVYEAETGNLTWAGRRVLKPWYLDELPQLCNVLRGDISLVGPRPWPPAMVDRQVAEGLRYRLDVPAGLTGAAQVTKGGRERYADLDLDYVERMRTLRGFALVRLDLGILARTLGVIARGQGLEF